MAYIAVAAGLPITVVETALFQRLSAGLWDDAGRESLVDFVARKPQAGDVIPGTGGVRKMRWGRQGVGKRGGVRVIYFYHDQHLAVSRSGLCQGAAGGHDPGPEAAGDRSCGSVEEIIPPLGW